MGEALLLAIGIPLVLVLSILAANWYYRLANRNRPASGMRSVWYGDLASNFGFAVLVMLGVLLGCMDLFLFHR